MRGSSGGNDSSAKSAPVVSGSDRAALGRDGTAHGGLENGVLERLQVSELANAGERGAHEDPSIDGKPTRGELGGEFGVVAIAATEEHIEEALRTQLEPLITVVGEPVEREGEGSQLEHGAPSGGVGWADSAVSEPHRVPRASTWYAPNRRGD